MKIILSTLIVLILFFPITSFAQFDFSFSGYIVDLPIYLIKKNSEEDFYPLEKNQLINLTRVRLRPTFYLWENARINIEHETGILLSKFALPGFNSATAKQVMGLSWNVIDKENFKLNHFIDRLYFRQGLKYGDITIGRQRISWGTGRIWNPTDLFNPLNPANYSKIEKDGADAISVKLNFDNFTDLNVVYNPQKIIKNSNTGFRFRTNFQAFDISLMGGYFDKRIVTGFDFAGNMFDAGIRGEGIVSMDEDDLSDNFIKYIFGLDNQFTSKLYGVIEYHFNGEGAKNISDYDFEKIAKSNILNLGRNYLFISATYQLSLVLNGLISNNINLNDGSGYINLTGNYSLSDNIYLNIGTQFTYGKSLTEYWFYPPSIYIQSELYF